MNPNNLIFQSLSNLEEESKNVAPAGYIKVELSTKGKLGAPKVIHIRNFKVKDVVALSLTSETDLPSRLIQILNEMIWEDTDVALWHEKEVEELMVYVFMSFYKPVLNDVPFEVTDEDKEWLKNNGKDDYLNAIEKGEFSPTTTITLASGLDTYEISDDFEPRITITNRKTGFFATFDYVHYGDHVIIKKWLEGFYEEKEKKFKTVKDSLRINNELISRFEKDPSVINKLIPIDAQLRKEYSEFINEKLETLSEIVRYISVVNLNGKDIKDLSISEKYKLLSEEPQLDYGMISKLSKRQEKQHFGLKPLVKMTNPITREVCERPYTFRIPLIIQTIQLEGSEGYDDGYDDED